MSIYQEYLMYKFNYLEDEVEDLNARECIALIADLLEANNASIR